MHFTDIYVENFLSYERARLSLDGVGLCLITGSIQHSGMADSNGSGKSALLPDMLIYALFGRTTRGARGKDVIRWGQDYCLVQLQGRAGDGTGFLIQRCEGSYDGRPCVIVGNNPPITGRDQMNVALSALLGGVSYGTLTASIVRSADSRFFTQLDDASRKTVLEEILGLTELTKFQEEAKRKARIFQAQVCTAEVQAGSTRMALVEARSSVERARTAHDALQSAGAQEEAVGQQYRAEEVAAKEELADASTRSRALGAEHVRVQAALIETESQIEEHRETLVQVQRLRSLAEASLSQIAEAAARISSFKGECPLCFSEVTEAHRARVLRGFGPKHTAAKQKLDSYDLRIGKLKANVEKLHKRLAPGRAKLAKLAEELLAARGAARACEARITRAQEAARASATRLQALEEAAAKVSVEEAEGRVAQLEGELAAHEVASETANQQRLLYDFWVDGFGNSGIKSFLMDGVIPRLNESAYRYAELLTGGEMQVEFSLQKTLKNGETREKFDVLVTINGAGSYQSCSAGQRRRADLVVTLALGDLASQRAGQPFNLLVLDEVFDGLDATGIERVMDVLRALSTERSSIFVITHNQQLASYFPRQIVVEYTDGVSRLAA